MRREERIIVLIVREPEVVQAIRAQIRALSSAMRALVQSPVFKFLTPGLIAITARAFARLMSTGRWPWE